MSGRLAIDALRQGRSWSRPILLPSAVGLGARIDAQLPDLVWCDAQKLADACVAAARYLGADAIWVPSFGPTDAPDLDALTHRDAVERAIAAAARLQMGCVVEIRGPLARALALGGELDEALKLVKPVMIAEFEALAQLRPDIIVLAEPEPTTLQAESRVLARLYGALRRLAEHYDILKGMKPAMPGMSQEAMPDLSFAAEAGMAEGRCALAVGADWTDVASFAGAVASALARARAAQLPLVVCCVTPLGDEIEPIRCREAVAQIAESV